MLAKLKKGKYIYGEPTREYPLGRPVQKGALFFFFPAISIFGQFFLDEFPCNYLSEIDEFSASFIFGRNR